jgi:AcrR family transcriptional regulator
MSPATSTAPRTRAKRGDGGKLREEILDQAERLLVESGSHETVSIRALAQCCDVTPPAVYLHFVDKETLFREVCTRRFVELDDRIEDARKTAADRLDELRTVGMAIVNFGLEHPAAYRLAVEAREGAVMPGVFSHLAASIERAGSAGALDEVDPHRAALVLWAGINGLTSSMIAFPAADWGDKQELIGYLLDVLIEGLLST